MARLLQEVEAAYNPHWGPMFREGDAQTRFADQIQQYAWAYTGAISNFYAYDPNGTIFAPCPPYPTNRSEPPPGVGKDFPIFAAFSLHASRMGATLPRFTGLNIPFHGPACSVSGNRTPPPSTTR